MEIAFIINPISGDKSKNHLPEIIKRIASETGNSAEFFFTEYAGHGSILAKELVEKGFSRIAAVGGDGTINEIGGQLINKESSLCIIPFGSGNGLARHLRIPLNPQKAVEVAFKNESHLIDTATINGTPFFCTAGVGFDALISNKFAAAPTRGLSTYASIATKEYFRYLPQRYKITIDGKTYNREAFLITIANASQYGNNAYIAPKANVQDGILNLIVVSAFPLIEAPFFAARMFSKSLESSRFTENFKGKEITIERATNDFVHYDGEPSSMSAKLTIKVFPSSLKIVY